MQYGTDDHPRPIYDKIHVKDVSEHPIYYCQGRIEVWDFIKDKNLSYDKGCAIKYICRAGLKNKDTEIEDLKKAINYINHEIRYLENNNIAENI